LGIRFAFIGCPILSAIRARWVSAGDHEQLLKFSFLHGITMLYFVNGSVVRKANVPF